MSDKGKDLEVMFVRELVFLATFWFASKISMGAIYWSLDPTNVLVLMFVCLMIAVVYKGFLRKVSDPTSNG